MLRKDALSKIKLILDNLDNVCTNSIKADVILNQLERLGMQPPMYKKLIKTELSEYFITRQEWENETV